MPPMSRIESTRAKHPRPASRPPVGRHRWAIAEGYIPAESTGPEPEMTSFV